MDLETWMPIYYAIASDLNLDPRGDSDAADILSEGLRKNHLIANPASTLEEVNSMIAGKNAYVFGAGPDLEQELDLFTTQRVVKRSGPRPRPDQEVLIAADGASSALLSRGVRPDIIVTDLDGDMNAQIECLKRNTVMFVHAHSDNVSRIREAVPRMEGRVVGTTQVYPKESGKLVNFGGFSDGDRAVFLAQRYRARMIILLGFNFNEVGEKLGEGGDRVPLTREEEDWKFRKLAWASILLGFVVRPRVVSFSEKTSILGELLGAS